MKDNEEILITYKFYDEQGRRVAIFGIPTSSDIKKAENNSLRIVIITCSKKDNFCKETAKRHFKAYLTNDPSIEAHPKEVVLTGITDGNFKSAFMLYCKTHFQKPVHWTERYWVEAVKNKQKKRILQKVSLSNKMNSYSIE